MTVATTSCENFRRAIKQAGLTPPDEIVPDGQVHRFSSNGDQDDDAGWYIFFPDGVPTGVFGCWRMDIRQTWSDKSNSTLTPAERDRQQTQFEEARRQRDAEARRRHAEAATRARAIWDQAAPATPEHPYLQRKRVQSHGLRLTADNRLIVPVRIDGVITSLQFISADGSKQFLPGGEVKGGSLTLGDPTRARTVVLGEGVATMASIREATGYAAVVAFSAGNLLLVAQALRAQYPTAQILVCGDHDDSGVGQEKAQAAADAVGGVAVIPDSVGDWNDIAARDGRETVRQLLDLALGSRVDSSPSTDSSSSDSPPPDEPRADTPIGTFSPVSAPQLFDEPEPVQPEWVWEDFLPKGGLGALVAKPKVGKTTNAYELTVKVAQGLPYLGRATYRGPVLILAMEEHRREVKRRLRNLGADQIEEIHLHVGPLADSPDTFHQLKRYIRQHRIILVVLDTLNSFWSVQEENDAVAVTQAIKPLLALARESGAAVLLLHHARKSEGEFGDEIRGSGALFSLLDVALILKRHEIENQRKLTAISRYPETPPELIIELLEHGHEALGDPASVGKSAKIAKVRAALTDAPEPAQEISRRAGVSRTAVYTILDGLVAHGQVQRSGTGKRGNPYLYCNCVSPLRGGGVNETNSSPHPNDHELSRPGGFVSFGVPILVPQENETHSGEDGIVSFRGDGGQTKRNGVEGEEDCHEPEGLFTEEVVHDDH